jgi:hypothetical protein
MSEPAAAAVAVAGPGAVPHYEGVGRRLLAALLDNVIWLVAALWAARLIPVGAYDSDLVAIYFLVL